MLDRQKWCFGQDLHPHGSITVSPGSKPEPIPKRLKLVRHPGAAPGCPVWKTGILANVDEWRMVAAVGNAPTFPAFQTGANLSQLNSHKKVVLARGNAPRSVSYRLTALLLSYARMVRDQGIAP